MNRLLLYRLKKAEHGTVNYGDTHERIHSDALTEVMRLEDQQGKLLKRIDDFRKSHAFIRGWAETMKEMTGSDLFEDLFHHLEKVENEDGARRGEDSGGS